MKTFKTFVCVSLFLFFPYKYSLFFPYVKLNDLSMAEFRIQPFFELLPGGGMINYPIVFCLLYLFWNITRKGRPPALNLGLVFLVIAAAMMFSISLAIGYHERYSIDFASFIILPSLFCAYCWCGSGTAAGSDVLYRLRMKITYVLLAMSVFVGLFLSVGGQGWESLSPSDPVLYRYLECAFGFVRYI